MHVIITNEIRKGIMVIIMIIMIILTIRIITMSRIRHINIFGCQMFNIYKNRFIIKSQLRLQWPWALSFNALKYLSVLYRITHIYVFLFVA